MKCWYLHSQFPENSMRGDRDRPWENDPCLGKMIAPFDFGVGVRQTILKMQNYGPPQVRTIELWSDWNDNSLVDLAFNLIGEVTFGCGGAAQTFELDWLNGTSFSVPCSSLEVVCRYEAIGSGARPSDLKVSAMIGVGGKVHHNPVRSYKQLDAITSGGGTASVKIPPFAKKVRILDIESTTSYNVSGNIIRFFSCDPSVSTTQLGEYVADGSITNFTWWSDDGIRIPNGARYVQFEANGGTDVTLIWEFELDV